MVKLCYEHGIAIVPQGGNTGLMGGATPYPTHSGIVLSLGRMNKVIEVDPVGYSMTVEAGCILQTLQETAASHDRFFPLSLGAQGSCLIGGNLSTNAGGVQVLRYGNARNLVMGLEVVLPNGDIWNGLRSLKKDNTGYDLKHLFMGAEGTLGHHHQGGAEAVARAQGRGDGVARRARSAGRHRDPVGGACGVGRQCRLVRADEPRRHRHGAAPYPRRAGSAQGRHQLVPAARMVVVAAQGRRRPGMGMSEKLEQFLADQFEAGRVLDAVIAQNEAQARNMWVIRELVAPASRAEGPGLSYDVSVSTSKVPVFIDKGLKAVLEILPSIRPYPLGHIGDGNIHFSFMVAGRHGPRDAAAVFAGDHAGGERPGARHGGLDLGRARHRHRQDRRAGALPLARSSSTPCARSSARSIRRTS